MKKSEISDEELLELLKQTSSMTAEAARKQYDDFVYSTSSRVDGVIYRLKHHYNLGKKLNNINKQS